MVVKTGLTVDKFLSQWKRCAKKSFSLHYLAAWKYKTCSIYFSIISYPLLFSVIIMSKQRKYQKVKLKAKYTWTEEDMENALYIWIGISSRSNKKGSCKKKKKKNGIQGYASGQIMNNLESLGWRFDFDQYRFPLLLFYLIKRLKTKMYQKYFQSILEPN